MRSDISKVQDRDSSFELLRIVAMFSIVAYHFAVHGGFHYNSNVLSIPRIWLCFLSMGGEYGG